MAHLDPLNKKDFEAVNKLLNTIYRLTIQIKHDYNFIKFKKFDEVTYKKFKLACLRLDRKLKLLEKIDKEFSNKPNENNL